MVGQQQVDIRAGVGGDAQEEIAQVDEGVQVMALGAPDEAVEGGCGASAPVTSDKQKILSPDGNTAQGVLRRIVVDGEVAVVKIAQQCLPLVLGVGDGLADGTLGKRPVNAV